MKRASFVPIGLIAAFFLLFTSCGDSDCVKGEGEVERQELQVDELEAITVEGPIDVVLYRSDSQQVEVEGQPNLIGLMRTEVRDGVWAIRTSQCINTSKDLVVHLSLPQITSISIEGSGEVTTEDQFDGGSMDLHIAGSGEIEMIVNANTVNTSITGSGDLAVMGMCQDLTATINGSGNIKAGDLQATRAEAEVVGSGDLDLHVTDELKATVTGSGDIRYKGSPPNVNKNVTGSGDIREK